MDVLALSSLLGGSTIDGAARSTDAAAAVTPASFGPARPIDGPTEPSGGLGGATDRTRPAESRNDAIWAADEIPPASADFKPTPSSDPRPPPNHEVYYRQDVGTEDVFLGSTDKTPGSGDCTHLVVKVHFPGCRLGDVELEVTRESLTAESEDRRLFMYLPQPVKEEEGNAKWDAINEVLVVTLPIERVVL